MSTPMSRRLTRRSVLRTAAIGAATLLIATGCGDDETPSDENENEPGENEPDEDGGDT